MQFALAAGVYVAMFLLVSHVNGRVDAYLDPGTGSIVIQAVLAGVVGALSIARLYWHRVKSLFNKGTNKDKSLIGD